jgi:hypothetical protein
MKLSILSSSKIDELMIRKRVEMSEKVAQIFKEEGDQKDEKLDQFLTKFENYEREFGKGGSTMIDARTRLGHEKEQYRLFKVILSLFTIRFKKRKRQKNQSSNKFSRMPK